MGELWSRLSERHKKLLSWLAVGVVLGVGILVLQPATPSQISTSLPQQQVETPSSESAQERWARELSAILNTMLGGKRSQVFLTMERGPKLNIAYNVTEEERHTLEGSSDRRRTSNPVLLRNDAERKEVPLILEQIEPTVRGVLVVLDHEPGADLRLAIAQAVATALQVPMYRIEVLFKQ